MDIDLLRSFIGGGQVHVEVPRDSEDLSKGFATIVMDIAHALPEKPFDSGKSGLLVRSTIGIAREGSGKWMPSSKLDVLLIDFEQPDENGAVGAKAEVRLMPIHVVHYAATLYPKGHPKCVDLATALERHDIAALLREHGALEIDASVRMIGKGLQLQLSYVVVNGERVLVRGSWPVLTPSHACERMEFTSVRTWGDGVMLIGTYHWTWDNGMKDVRASHIFVGYGTDIQSAANDAIERCHYLPHYDGSDFTMESTIDRVLAAFEESKLISFGVIKSIRRKKHSYPKIVTDRGGKFVFNQDFSLDSRGVIWGTIGDGERAWTAAFVVADDPIFADYFASLDRD